MPPSILPSVHPILGRQEDFETWYCLREYRYITSIRLSRLVLSERDMGEHMAKGIQKFSLRQPIETRRRSPIRPAYVILAVLLALFALKFVQKMGEVRQLQAQETALQMANAHTHRQNVNLQHAIRYYHTVQYVEQEARSVLDFTMPGNVSILTAPRKAPVVAMRAAPPKPLPPPLPTWEQWWHAMFH